MNGYVSADYLRRAAELCRSVKERSYRMLEIAPGAHLLDVGCGPGIDVVALAAQLGAEGRVTGVDNDPAMLAEGRAAAQQAGVDQRTEFVAASAARLPWTQPMFDGVRAERLLQVLPAALAAERVIAELLRVLRPGGRLVVVDTDWASASVDFPDTELERRLLGFFAAGLRPNGYAGRQMFALLRAEGLEGIECEVVPLVHYTVQDTPYGTWLPDEALAAGIVSPDEAALWREELTQRERAGRFFATVNMLIVSGRKPGETG